MERRKVDATLARFSAVHDEMAREERERRNRWHKLMPWRETDDPLDDALSAATPHMGAEPPEQTSDTAEKPVKKKIIRRPLTRLQRKRAKQREQSAMAGRIAACVAAGRFRPCNTDLVAYHLVMLAHSWALKRWHLKTMITLEAYVDECLAVFLDGLAAR